MKNTVLLPDKRKLAFNEWGEGRPVLFCSGAAMSGAMGFGQSELESLGVKLVGIDRPGLGQSTTDTSKTFSSWVADVRSLCEQRNYVDPLAVGFSQGAPFALALAHEGLVKRVAIVAGQDELTHPTILPLLPPEVAGFVENVRSRNREFMTGFRKMVGVEGMMNLIESNSSPKDAAFYKSEPFRTQFRESLTEGFAAGPDGYLRDLQLAMSPWPFRIEEIKVPVALWYGKLDASPVHSPDFGVTLHKRLPNSELHNLEDEGGSLLWTRSREILETLLREIPIHQA